MSKHLSLFLVGAWGCVDKLPGEVTGTQSIRVEVTSPADPGSVDQRLDDSARMVTMNLTALGPDGEPDPSFTTDLAVYAQFLGTLTPSLDAKDPLARIHMTNGVAMNQKVMLPATFGPTTLWIDDGRSASPTYATGTSPTLWYRDAFIVDMQKPTDETDVETALAHSPLEDKQVTISGSRYGANGRLVVTSVFAQGYTVSDVQCGAGGAPPCMPMDYDHAMIFSFSAPRDQDGRILKEGQVISGFGGGVSEYNELTEINFPRSFAPEEIDVNPARLPAPVLVDDTWFAPLSDPNGRIKFEKNEARLLELDGGTLCPLDDAYTKYKQWKLSPDGNCGAGVISVVTTGVVTELDMAKLASLEGRVFPKVLGVLRPAFNNWIIYPRTAEDVTQP